MKYSSDPTKYTIIAEDSSDFMGYNCDVIELDDEKFEFHGTLQSFGEELEACGYRQEDIREHIKEFVNSGFQPNSGLECWVQSGSCYFYLKNQKK